MAGYVHVYTGDGKGKTTAALGLLEAMSEHFERVGYIKPVGQQVRLIGVGISGWREARTEQADLFADSGAPTADRRVLETIDAVEDKFGRGLLQVGVSRKAGKESR